MKREKLDVLGESPIGNQKAFGWDAFHAIEEQHENLLALESRVDSLRDVFVRCDNERLGLKSEIAEMRSRVAALESALGALEELGELAHAHLKGLQGIRHTPEEIATKKEDAVADVVIFLSDYCSASGIDFQAAVEKTWAEVRKRDWKANPLTALAPCAHDKLGPGGSCRKCGGS